MKNIILLFTGLFACAVAAAQEKTIDKVFSNVDNIRLNTSSGDIRLQKNAGSEVRVHVTYTHDDDNYKIVMEQSDSRLVLKEEFEHGNFSGNSHWTLEIPDNMDININTGSGNITAEKLTIEIKSNTGSGNITLTELEGELDFNTGSGDIELENVSGEVALNTGSGNIEADGGTGTYSFNAGSGDIRLQEVAGDFSMNTGSGNIDARVRTVSASSSFNTGSGNATVVLAGPLEHDMNVNSGSGNATLNFSGSTIAGEVIMTANERNGEIVAPFKFDKEEVIDNGAGSPRMRKTAQLGTKDITIKVGTGSGKAEIVK